MTVVETKLRRNREACREVVGQIIEYASYVSQWTADDVYRIANEYFTKSEKAPQSYKGKTLDEIMKGIVGDEFSDEDFRIKIGQNLRDGRIRLVIAVDELIEPLRATVTFLNPHSNFDILLLQVADLEESDEESFLAQVRERSEPKIGDTIVKLYEFAKAKADHREKMWGTGTTSGSFFFRKLRRDKLLS